MNPPAAQSPPPIALPQWLGVLQRWFGLSHALVVGHNQQAIKLLNAAPDALTLFKAGSNASKAAAHTRPWLIAERTGPTTFHQASLPSESGLLPATALTGCWPGIKPLGQHQADALSLDDACAQASAEHTWASPPQWLWIGCLPATALLRGATRVLQTTDVVALRVQLHPGAEPDTSLPGAQALLQAHGFALCGVEPERNPHLGTALFVRDYPAAHSATRQQRDELAKAKSELQSQLAAETQAKQAEATAKAEAQKQRDELAKAKAELQAQVAAETQAKQAEATSKAQAQQQRDELAKAKTELQAQLAAETQAKQAEAAAKVQAQQQRDELAKAKTELQAQLSAETQAKQAEATSKAQAQQQRDELVKAKTELQAQLAAETQAKQAEATAKAEAQKQRDELAKAKAELQAQVAAETQAMQAEATAKAQAQHQLDELSKAHTELQAQLAAEAKARQAEAAANASANAAAHSLVQSHQQAHEQANVQIQALQQENASLHIAHAQLSAQLQSLEQVHSTLLTQQGHMDDRFLAAEAQIDLIKALILGERAGIDISSSDDDIALDFDETAPDDPNPKLLQRAMTQWQFGDWKSLSQLDLPTLRNHPDRAQLALYAAAGHQQTGDVEQTKRCIRLAASWGCSPTLIKQVLISGVHNALGRVAAKLGQPACSHRHFEAAIDTGSPDSDRLVKQARATYQQQMTEDGQTKS
jgi:hypothetical protein